MVLQFFNPQTREHLVSINGQQRALNLTDSTIKWEKIDRKHAALPQPPQQLKKQQDGAQTPAAAGAGAGQHAPHAKQMSAAELAEAKINENAVSREPPVPDFKSPHAGALSQGRRIRVWWPDDKAWYAGEIKVREYCYYYWRSRTVRATTLTSSLFLAATCCGMVTFKEVHVTASTISL